MRSLLLALWIAITPVAAQELRIIVPSNDDSYSINARVIGKYYARYLPERPTVVIQSVPGAASLVAANYLYNIAARDGTTIGTFYKEIPLVGLLQKENVRFDPNKFNWIGSIVDGRKDTVILWSRKQFFYPNMIVGSEGVGNVANFIDNLMHQNFNHVNGYANTGTARLALERGEIEGAFWSLVGIKAQKPDWLKQGSGIYPILQLGNGKQRHPDYMSVPTVADYITNDTDMQMLQAFESQFVLVRPFVAPPGVSPERVKQLREAFDKAVKDPEYLADAAKANLEVTPISGKEAESIINLTSKTDSGIINMLKEIIK